MRTVPHENLRTLKHLLFAVLFIASISMAERAVDAAIVTTGDVNPADPATWTGGTTVTIGNTADGSATVDGGSIVQTATVDMAKTPGVTGTLTMDGPGSTWNTNGFAVINAGTSSLINNLAGGTGIVNIRNGATINAGINLGRAFNSTGLLNITTGGQLTRGGVLGQSLLSKGMAVVDGAGSQWSTGGGAIEVGSRGTGLLTITNGGIVRNDSSSASLGTFDTGAGRAILDGPGSKWTVEGTLTVAAGQSTSVPGNTGGTGLITISNGAVLSAQNEVRMGGLSRAVGTVMVNGAGSAWNSGINGGCSGVFPPSAVCGLNVGLQGTGQVSVSDGGSLTTNNLYITDKSMMTVDLGTGSTVTVSGGTGPLTNNGTIRMAAKATAANGTYTPITAGTWSGTGTVQALGGVYNPATHSVTVSSAATGTAGSAVTIDRSTTQRILITDGASGKQVGASFQAAIAPANLSLTASLMNNSQLSLLQGLLDPGKAILSGWNFSATGYTTGDPVYLSLQVGGGQKFYDLDVWHFDGTSWGKYLNTDLAYDDTFASFVATGFSGYAVSGVAAVPVPAAIWLFGSGIAVIGLVRRRITSSM